MITLTKTQYLDPKRFPLTTQKGLDYKGQRMIDAFNYDQLVEGVELKTEPLGWEDRVKGRALELAEKLGLPNPLEKR